MDEKKLVQEFVSQKTLYIVKSNMTRLTYIYCNPDTMDDEAGLFYTEEDARSEVAALILKGEPVEVATVEQKGYLEFFAELSTMGVNSVKMVREQKETHVSLDAFVRQQDMSKIPENKRPPENKALYLTLLYYLQEARKDEEKRDMAKLTELNEELMAGVARGRFLLPMQPGKMVGGKLESQVQLLKLSNGAMVFPIFTDTVAAGKFTGPTKTPLFPVTVSNLLQNIAKMNVKGALLNPGGLGFYMPVELMKQAVSMFED